MLAAKNFPVYRLKFNKILKWENGRKFFRFLLHENGIPNRTHTHTHSRTKLYYLTTAFLSAGCSRRLGRGSEGQSNIIIIYDCIPLCRQRRRANKHKHKHTHTQQASKQKAVNLLNFVVNKK